MDITEKLLELYQDDSIVRGIISRYIDRKHKNYFDNEADWRVSRTMEIIRDFREEIVFDIMLMYKKMLDENHKLILKILEESKTPIIIDKKNFIKLSEKKGVKKS